MERAGHRSMLALAAFSTAGALALAPIAVAPPGIHAPSTSPPRVSTQAVQLTDAWSELVTDTVANVIQLGAMFLGADNNFPLPNPTIPLAPVATQLVLNQLVYLGQLLTGQGGQIPGEITNHFFNVLNLAQGLGNDLPGIIVAQLQTPIQAVQGAVNYIANTGNLLIGLLEAPAVFLNVALNSQYGLIGVNGPIAVPIIIRNLLAKSIEVPIPPIVLPFKKASAAALTPEPAAAAVTVKSVAPKHTAGSARSGSKAPAAASSARKAGDNGAGVGHGKRK